MNEENALDADTLEYATNGDCLVHTVTGVLDNHAFIALSALFAAFDDFDEDLDGVADVECGQVALDERGFDFVGDAVRDSLIFGLRRYRKAI